MTEYIPIAIPAIVGYGSAMFCKVGSDAGGNVVFRPPPIVFTLVWPVLYLLLGLSWYYARRNKNTLTDVFYSILTLLLSLWIVLYSCKKDKKSAIYVLLIALVFSGLCYTISDDKTSKLLILPLIGWILFAMLLNIFEVQTL